MSFQYLNNNHIENDYQWLLCLQNYIISRKHAGYQTNLQCLEGGQNKFISFQSLWNVEIPCHSTITEHLLTYFNMFTYSRPGYFRISRGAKSFISTDSLASICMATHLNKHSSLYHSMWLVLASCFTIILGGPSLAHGQTSDGLGPNEATLNMVLIHH